MRRVLKSILIFVAFAAIYTLSRHAVIGGNSTTTTQGSSLTTTTMSVPAGPACQGSDFHGVFNQGQGAAGTIYASVTLTKTTTGNCTLNGFPLLILQDKVGSVLKSTLTNVSGGNGPVQFTDTKANDAPSAVNLAQKSKVDFSFAYSDVPTGSQRTCANAVVLGIQIEKGGSVTSVTPAYGIAACNNGQLWVSPFY